MQTADWCDMLPMGFWKGFNLLLLFHTLQLVTDCSPFGNVFNNKDVRFWPYSPSVYNNSAMHSLENICEDLQSHNVKHLSVWKSPLFGWLPLQFVYHEFLVYETRGPYNEKSFWSIGKNSNGFELQHSTQMEDVVYNIGYENRSAKSFSWKPQIIREHSFSHPIPANTMLSFLREWTGAFNST